MWGGGETEEVLRLGSLERGNVDQLQKEDSLMGMYWVSIHQPDGEVLSNHVHPLANMY